MNQEILVNIPFLTVVLIFVYFYISLFLSTADVKCSYKPIIRTVENDIAIIDDPLEKMCEPIGTSLTNRKASLQLKIVTHNSDAHR